MKSKEERFWSQTAYVGDCILWTGVIHSRFGYGLVYFDRKVRRAHRVAFVLNGGILVKGLQLDHLCHNRACVNPNHLRQVTARENLLASNSESLTKYNHVKTHCPVGHPYEGRNLIKVKYGRMCRACNLRRTNQYQAERKRQGLCMRCKNPANKTKLFCELHAIENRKAQLKYKNKIKALKA